MGLLIILHPEIEKKSHKLQNKILLKFHPGLTVEVSRSYSDTQNSVGLLWTSDRVIGPSQKPLSGNTQQTSIHPPPPPAEFEPAIPASKRPPDLHLRPRGQRTLYIYIYNHSNKVTVKLKLFLFKLSRSTGE